ncbi:MAG: hypothetical protein SFZ02_10075 [bacterium]|nr:hypothetical protein [bacterium]
MSDDITKQNAWIRTKINVNDVDEARALLAEALPKGNSETYYLASLIATTDEERYAHLENAIGLDDTNEEAQKAFTELFERNPHYYDPRKTRALFITCGVLAVVSVIGMIIAVILTWQ